MASFFDPKDNAPPTTATGAVLVTSEPVPEGVQQVQGIDFNKFHNTDMKVLDLVAGMTNMGFQASAIGDAVRIVNGMVRNETNHIRSSDS